MINYGPKRKRQTGKWDYCVTDHFNNTEPIGHCKTNWDSGSKEGHHNTPEEAVKCFLSYSMDSATFDGKIIMGQPCASCGNTSFSCAMIAGEPFVVLCSGHLNRRTLEKMLQKMTFQVYSEICDDGK